MSLSIVISCEQPFPYGTCAARFHTSATTEAEAYAAAERAGWNAGRGTDRCPGHAPRPRRRSGPPGGNNPQTPLAPGDQEAVAEFKDYFKRRAAGAPPAAPHTT
ncbi:hypothetical protein ACIRJR_09480 [Streptomyces sp. NPDC102402]|uniref:hypothetical protein n=1 Tax=Streptomyces sp. NPDC102402 TaxID=3366169 RepID=UPI00380ED00E